MNMKHTITLLIALLLAPLAALHAAPLSASLDAPSWKPLTTAVPEARRPGAFDARKEEGLRLTFSDLPARQATASKHPVN